MAHLPMLREWRARWFSLRDRLPLDCLLCRSRTAGGLCLHCSRAVTASVAADDGRCPRCALALSHTVGEAVLPTGDTASNHGAGRLPCPDCQALSPALERVIAAFDYAWPGDLLIQRLKLQGRFSCVPVLAALLAARCQALRAEGPAPSLWCERHTLVTAVPASSRSLVLRGYNPAGEVGRALARRLGLAWRPGLLRRSQDQQDQKSLGRRARRMGVQGLYHCPGGVAGREVLVVDDVMTTGATLSAIADALQQQGAARIWAVVLARTRL